MAALALVFANGYFVAAEFAAVGARRTRLEQLAAGNLLGRTAMVVKRRLDLYLSTCQFGITLASLGLGAVTEPAIATLLSPALKLFALEPHTQHAIAFAIAMAISTTLHITIGEIAPKNWAIQYADRILPPLSLPLVLFTFVFYPAIWVLNEMSNLVLKIAGIHVVEGLHGEPAHSEEELRAILVSSVAAGTIDKGEGKLLESAFSFAQRRVRQIMTPRTSVDFLLVEQPLREILSVVQKTQYTRLPLCKGDLDHVVGLIHMKDLFNQLKLVPGRLRFADATTPENEAIAIVDGKPGSALHLIGSADIDLNKICRDVLFVPDSLSLPKLLHQFQAQHAHMAVVVNEYGATQGIVTMEDVLEELVGEIGDEFDPISAGDFVEQKDGSYRVSGLFALHELKQRLGVEAKDEDVDTVGGYVVQKLGRWPRVGDTVELDGHTIRVLTIVQKRVGQAMIKRTTGAMGQ